MIAWLVACAPEPLVDGLGASGDGMMVWGRRIAYGSPAGVVVTDPDTGDVEILDDRSTRILLRDGVGLISTPGECVEGCEVAAVHLDFDGGTDTIVEGVRSRRQYTVVIDPNGARLAYLPMADTAELPTFVAFDRATEAVTPVRPGLPLAFSPDGAEVLFHEGDAAAAQIVTLATGAVRDAGFDVAAGESVLAVKWGATLEVLATDGATVMRAGPEGGRAEVFATDDEVTGPVAFAPAGDKVAFWTRRCGDADCVQVDLRLWSVALDGSSSQRMGSAEFVAGPSYYDPASERLAWESGGALFVANVR